MRADERLKFIRDKHYKGNGLTNWFFRDSVANIQKDTLLEFEPDMNNGYGVFKFELSVDIYDVIHDLPEEKRAEIIKFIENYIPRR